MLYVSTSPIARKAGVRREDAVLSGLPEIFPMDPPALYHHGHVEKSRADKRHQSACHLDGRWQNLIESLFMAAFVLGGG